MCEQQRHRWADVIHAYAEGKPIQHKNTTCREPLWRDSDTLLGIEHEYMEWRIKPEKKTYWINVYKDKHKLQVGWIWPTLEEAVKNTELRSNYIKTISFEVEE